MHKKKTTVYLVSIISIFMIVFVSVGRASAEDIWHGTGWILRGSLIRSQFMRDNFDYLFRQLSPESGVRATGEYVACTASVAGALRFTPERGLEGCDGANWIIFLQPPPNAFGTCITREYTRSCTVPYSCNCGKGGCATCTGDGTQRRTASVCTNTAGTETVWPTAWGVCNMN